MLDEAKMINKSLSSLGNVISALAEGSVSQTNTVCVNQAAKPGKVEQINVLSSIEVLRLLEPILASVGKGHLHPDTSLLGNSETSADL